MPFQQQPDAQQGEERQPPDFGKPIDPTRLRALAKIDERDLASAIEWFDEHASAKWKGALD